MNLKELEAIASEKRAIQMNKHSILIEYIKNTINDFIKTNNLNSIVKIQHVSDSSAQLEIPRENKYGYTFDLYFHTPYFNEARKLEMNFGCFGSFTSNDVYEINYCNVLGIFASHLKELEQKLILSDEAKKFFDEYENAFSERSEAENKKRNFIAEQKKIEDDAKRKEFASKLVIGAQIEIGKDWYNKSKINEILHVTAKNILLENNYGRRTKKEVALDNLVSGRWKLV